MFIATVIMIAGTISSESTAQTILPDCTEVNFWIKAVETDFKKIKLVKKDEVLSSSRVMKGSGKSSFTKDDEISLCNITSTYTVKSEAEAAKIKETFQATLNSCLTSKGYSPDANMAMQDDDHNFTLVKWHANDNGIYNIYVSVDYKLNESKQWELKISITKSNAGAGAG